MPVSIARLRSSMLVLAGLLVAGILLVLGYARWQVRRITRDLPEKLGISVERSTNGFDVSKSQGGRTIFTLHAAKMIQYTGRGQAALRGVSITLYGADGAPADRIYGDDFTYDPVRSIVRANGAVQIDLQGPASSGPLPSSPAAGGKNIVHVKTADLAFDQKTGLASTAQPIEFSIADATGRATGASFNAHTGVCILESNVALDSSLKGRPLALRASHAQFDRVSHRLYLLTDAADYEASHSSSDQATVLFRPDGSAYRIDLHGHVSSSSAGRTVTSPNAQVNLDSKSQPQQAFLSGGVLYTADDPARQIHGTAVLGVLSFGPQAAIRHAQFKNAVSIVDEEKSPPPSITTRPGRGKREAEPYQSTTREVEASQIDIDFQQAAGRSIAQQILAQGGAALNVRTLYANSPPQETQVRGDQLLVTLRDGVALSALRGAGHTKLVMISPNGVNQTSTGDKLRMDFAGGKTAVPTSAALAMPQQAASLQSAEQEGNVVFVQQTPKPPAAPVRSAISAAPAGHAVWAGSGEVRATAQRAAFDAATQLITLYGAVRANTSGAAPAISVNPSIQQPGGELTATTIEFERATGNATATGDVKATYRQTPGEASGVTFGGPEPVHVIAARAHLDHGKSLTIFYGQDRTDARLWQGADSISAPVLELSGAQRTLSAHGAGDSSAPAVSAVLTGMGKPGEAAQPGKPGHPSVVRVSARTLLYSDQGSEAQLRGGVVMQDPSGAVRSNAMDVYFGPGSGATRAGGSGAKQVDRIVANGAVQLEQPGRRGAGDVLVYTASDGKFVLTGTNAAPPRLIDQAHGTVTGSSLIFNDRDDSVIVSGGPSKAVTETRTK